MKVRDLFIDFDDTLYDTHGNAVIALQELFEAFSLGRFTSDPQKFYDAYWEANIDPQPSTLTDTRNSRQTTPYSPISLHHSPSPK